MKNRDKLVREIETEDAIVGLRADGIYHVFFKDEFELDVPAQLRLLEIYKEITQERKAPFIFEAGLGVTVTKEARDNAIALEKIAPIGSCAVVVTNTAYVLIANFYYKFNKPSVPYGVFKRFEKGIQWLKTTDCYQPQSILSKTE